MPRAHTFTEHYDVKLDYPKRGGYWHIGHVEHVDVPLDDARHEKAQHDRAAKIAAAKFPGCEVVSVRYC